MKEPEELKIWYLYHSQTENRINALDYKSVSEILLKVPSEELCFWYGWNKNMKDWQTVESIEALQSIFKTRINEVILPPPPPQFPPPPPKKKQPHTMPPSSSQKKEAYTEKRKHPRFEIELKIIFKKENALFRTFTTNISEGGVALKNQLPEEFLHGESEIIISSPQWNENIKFKGRLAEHITHKNRVQFIETKEYFKQKLDLWLKEHRELKAKNGKKHA